MGISRNLNVSEKQFMDLSWIFTRVQREGPAVLYVSAVLELGRC
jgi:hypothetical protein